MMKRRTGSWFLLALVSLCLALIPCQPPTALAQEPNRVALVVDFGGGRYVTRCVEFMEDEITGEEVLKRSGLNVIFEYSSTGAAVCKIEDVGCSFPSDPCFCQCQGSDCVYWSYWRVENDRWFYSNEGASMRTVRDGDMEGWAWGSGSMGTSGRQPVWMPFLNICVPPTITPTPSLTPTETSIPTETPTPTYTFTPLPTTATPTGTVTPTRTRTPTRTPTRTWTPRPSNTPRPTGVLVSPTPWPTGTLPPIPTPTSGAAYPAPPTQQPTPSVIPTLVPSPPPSPTEKPAYPAPPATPSGAETETTPTAEPIVPLEVTQAVTQKVTEVPEATQQAAEVARTSEGSAATDRDVIASSEAAPTRIPRSRPSVPSSQTLQSASHTQAGVPWNHIIFGVMAAGLLASLVVVARRRRAQQ